ncbi:MAG: 2,3-bisphosphoglycerate-independent phosphoglycerate mutase [Thermoleophilia bacterium]|nr:2,3-bisphosphoglycerate-independent phosphoglycerate mutase [Thermoleophilia bacterium]
MVLPDDTIADLLVEAGTRIVLLVLDGLGGLAREPGGPTELEAASTPNLDLAAREGTCGLIEPVGAGITPGSGPGHLALFGYDPLRYTVGRGVLSALGIGFDLRPGDVAARGNFATLDDDGVVTDRRAGRLDSATGAELAELLAGIELGDVRLFVRPVKEHRFVLVLRGDGLSAALGDTDPQRTGTEPRPPEPLAEEAGTTARLVERFVEEARRRLRGREAATGVLLRGFATLPEWPGLRERFGLRAVALADYPMYRGVAQLVGMEVPEHGEGLDAAVTALGELWGGFDFFFVHRKQTDSAGEDGDFDRRVALLEDADAVLPRLFDLEPDVLVVTGDHSTPAVLGRHSWHPVPVLLWAATARADGVDGFGERQCRGGGLGSRFPAVELLPLALAHAGRLAKFGA